VFLTTGSPNAQNDWVGSVAAPLDPQLQPLADNGGPTLTHMPVLSPFSPVIDAGSCPAATTDQRGWFDPDTNLRIFDEPTVANLANGCDVGAVEALLSPPTILFDDGFESGDTSAWSRVEGGTP
jgi:hypothetical protein